MPNWCRNRVTVFGTEQEISEVEKIFASKDTVFGKIIPSPDWATIPNEDGELPKVDRDLIGTIHKEYHPYMQVAKSSLPL